MIYLHIPAEVWQHQCGQGHSLWTLGHAQHNPGWSLLGHFH